MKLQNSQKTETRLKVYPEKVYHEKYVKFPITKKNWQVKNLKHYFIKSIKASFCTKYFP